MTEANEKSRCRGAGQAPWLSLPVLCTAALVCVIFVHRQLNTVTAAEAEPYHNHVKEVAEAIPFNFGDWLGTDVAVPQGAITLLKPNVIVSRRYTQLGTGRSVTFLLVHCKDARDLLGHYPPICYRGQGWTMSASTPHDWTIRGMPIHGTKYVFQPGGKLGEQGQLAIDNFMMLPNGKTARDMREVGLAAENVRRKHFGAGQVQLVYDAALPQAERDRIFQDFTSAAWPVMSAVLQKDLAESQSPRGREPS